MQRRIKVGIVGLGLIGYGWHVKVIQRLSNFFEMAVCSKTIIQKFRIKNEMKEVYE